MGAFSLDRVLSPSQGAFVRSARARGISRRVARSLEAAAREVSPQAPEEVLNSRELFERTATRAVIGDGGNLELSFRLVDALASTLEELGLARSSDVPDPFRRVWVSKGTGERVRGVVLTCQKGEIAVFCPPSKQPLAQVGALLRLQYRSFDSTVQFELQLDDAVRLPGALVLHLTRPECAGEIGRASVRYRTCFKALVRALEPEAGRATYSPCEVVDISSGGLALNCALGFEKGQQVRVDLPLADGIARSFWAKAVVCWSAQRSPGEWSHGLAFEELPRPHAERLENYLKTLAAQQASARPEAPPPPTDGPESSAEPRPLPRRAAPARPTPGNPPAPGVVRTTPGALAPVAPAAGTRATHSPRVRPSPAPVDEIAWSEGASGESDPAPSSPPLRRPASTKDLELVQTILQQVCTHASSLLEYPLSCQNVRAHWRNSRSAGPLVVHIAFKFAFNVRGEPRHGCLLVRLPDALAMASSFLMLPLEVIRASRELDAPDEEMKQALLELDRVFASAIDDALPALCAGVRVESRGCQGVRPDIRPAFPYEEGTELLIGEASARFMEAEPFELILMLPALADRRSRRTTPRT